MRLTLAAVVFAATMMATPAVDAQQPPGARKPAVDAQRQQEADAKAAAALAAGPQAANEAPADVAIPGENKERPSWFDVYWLWGGPLMIPITAMSVLVVVFTFERLLGLRRSRVIPAPLVEGLMQLAGRSGGLDPRQALQLCKQYPSAAANVVQAVLLKVGRPHSELEHTMAEASEREATKLYRNVRTINLAVSVSPLLGLLGTVQGMILCFYQAANLAVGEDKYRVLSEGIYKALVTTFGGLVVAIPASVAAHYFEGRIQTLFHDIDELLLALLPQLERYEGKLRVTRSGDVARGSSIPVPPPPPEAAPEAPLVTKS